MSDATDSGFGKFVPGFDFLQSLAKGASNTIPQMPNLANWVSPSLNVEELDKRISELKSVHFWLDQNSKALGATIQALEVQRMTLATLKGMNFNMGDVANALKLKAADSVVSGVQKVTEKAASTAKTLTGVASDVASSVSNSGKAGKGKPASGIAGLVDPLQLWGSLTQQFQQIAASAMKEAGRNTAIDATKNMVDGLAKEAVKAARGRTATASKKIANKPSVTRATAKKAVKKAVR
jgi:hypothetical protein